MTAEEFCRYLWQSYLVERRYELLDDIVHEDITVIGTGAHELYRNMDDLTLSMMKESGEWQGSFIIKEQWYQTTQLSEAVFLVIGEMVVKEELTDGIMFDVRFRFSAILQKNMHSWKLMHLHHSVADPNQAHDEFFPHRMVETSGQQIIYNLRHDSMTGVLNRLYLTDIVNRTMAETPQGQLMMIDVDDFKQLNDSYGHPFGDKVLILLAQSLKAAFKNAVIGRVGGDEFVVYVPGKRTPLELEPFIQEFKKDWKESQLALKLPYTISVSIGISQCPADGTTYKAVWKIADKSLYLAKGLGKNQVYYQHATGQGTIIL